MAQVNPWSTLYPGAQDSPLTEQPVLDDDIIPGDNTGDRVLVSHVHTLRDKLDAVCKIVGDTSDLPGGSLSDRVTILEAGAGAALTDTQIGFGDGGDLLTGSADLVYIDATKQIVLGPTAGDRIEFLPGTGTGIEETRSGESFPRWALQDAGGVGSLLFGAGAAAPNSGLSLSATNTLTLSTDGTVGVTLDANQSFILGLAAHGGTAETSPYFYTPTVPGTPTGVPTAYAGREPTIIDDTNDLFYFHSGGTWFSLDPAAGGAALTDTHIGFGDGSNLLTGSADFIYDGVKTIQATEDAGTTNIVTLSEFRRNSSGTTAVGFGVGQDFYLEPSTGGAAVAVMRMQVVLRNASPAQAVVRFNAFNDIHHLLSIYPTNDDIVEIGVDLGAIEPAIDEKGLFFRAHPLGTTGTFGASIKVFGGQTEGTVNVQGVRYRSEKHEFRGEGATDDTFLELFGIQRITSNTTTAKFELLNGSTATTLSGRAGLKYDEGTQKLRWQQNGSAWADLDAFGGGTFSGTVATDQIAFGTATDVLGSDAGLQWLDAAAVKSFQVNSLPTAASSAGLDWDGTRLGGIMTLTGTTEINELSMVRVLQGAINGSAANVIDASSFTIVGPPTNGGSVTFDASWALRIVAGNSLFGGTLLTSGIGTKDLVAYAVGVVDTGMFANGGGDLHLSHTGTDALEIFKNGADTSLRSVALGTVDNPAWGYTMDTNTGTRLTGSSSDDVGHVGGGVDRMIVFSGGTPDTETGGIQVRDGLVTEVSVGFINDAGLGMFRPADNTIGWAVDGVQLLSLDVIGLALVSSPTIASAGGATWDGFDVSGTLSITGNTLITALALTQFQAPTIVGDTATAVITDASTVEIAGPPDDTDAEITITNPWSLRVVTGKSFFGGPLFVPGGDNSDPGLVIGANADSGLFEVSNDRIGVTLGGNSAYIFKTTGFEITGSRQLQAAFGTVGAPGISFATDTNSGLTRSAADNVKGVAGGIECIHWAETGGTTSLVGFHGTAAVAQIDIVGVRDDPEEALADLITKLATTGILTDSTTQT